MLELLKGKNILITGGTGSFGQAFVKMLLEKSEANKIIIFSRDELKQSLMASSLPDPQEKLRFFIGDVRDQERLLRAFDGVDYIVHAAALKQVPILEYNPLEAIKTNIIGTQNVINAALDRKVKKVVLLSTDKAANPANLYGATKLCAEKLVVASNAYAGVNGTQLSVVRYGNVFGSRGSLVKILQEQRNTGEVTLTHEEMTRFWITLPQGMDFVLLALEKMHGGEIFIPKIPSMSVKEMIQTLAPDCRIKVTGIRPGEKIHEVLITPEEARHTKELENYFVILPENNWLPSECYAEGKNMENGFFLASHNNPGNLDKAKLDILLQSL